MEPRTHAATIQPYFSSTRSPSSSSSSARYPYINTIQHSKFLLCNGHSIVNCCQPLYQKYNLNDLYIRRKYCFYRNSAVSAVRKAKHSFLKSMTSLIRSPKQFLVGLPLSHAQSCTYDTIPHTLTYGSISAESSTSKANMLTSFFYSCSPLSLPPQILCLICHTSNAQKRKF